MYDSRLSKRECYESGYADGSLSVTEEILEHKNCKKEITTIEYKNLDKYICDKVYRVETKEHSIYTGYLLNYNWGNLVLLTLKGVVHLQYRDIAFMAPITKYSEELQTIINDIRQEHLYDKK